MAKEELQEIIEIDEGYGKIYFVLEILTHMDIFQEASVLSRMICLALGKR